MFHVKTQGSEVAERVLGGADVVAVHAQRRGAHGGRGEGAGHVRRDVRDRAVGIIL